MDVSDKAYVVGNTAVALANQHSDDIAPLQGWVEIKYRVNVDTGEHTGFGYRELEGPSDD